MRVNECVSQAFADRCRQIVALQDRPSHAESFVHSPANEVGVATADHAPIKAGCFRSIRGMASLAEDTEAALACRCILA